MTIVLACLCGGVGEVVAVVGFVSVVTAVTAWLTDRYNRYRCRKHHCKHNH